LAIRFTHRGRKWEADTPDEAVSLRRALEEWDVADAQVGKGVPLTQYLRAESPWTPDTLWNFVHKIGSFQQKAVVVLMEKDFLWSHELAKEIGIEESALGGVLSGLSKQLKQLELRSSDLYQVHTDWSGAERKRRFWLQPSFRLVAEEVGWPEERKGENAASTKSKAGAKH
jgi:hypothetical protein